jgi:hypothetical protein
LNYDDVTTQYFIVSADGSNCLEKLTITAAEMEAKKDTRWVAIDPADLTTCLS